jgi:arabinogalactan oligomer/maltooligosaccharide transport system substrate-binding protein
MRKILFNLLGVLVLVSFLASACAPAATPTPTPKPAPTPVPPTATPAPKPVTLTLWHSYHTGGSEEQAITQIVANYQKANPNVTVNMLAIPFDQIFTKWETEVAAGGGPDMFTVPNDNLGTEVRANLIAPIDDLVAGKLDQVSKAGVAGMTVGGKIYGVPGIIKAVALYYNKSTVSNPPKTTDDLLNLVKGGKKLVLFSGGAAPYFNFGWFPAFGGKLTDDKGKCIADQGGFADAMQFLLDLKTAGADFESDTGKGATLFEQGQVDMVVDGPWMLGDYKKNLGDKLGVAPMPTGPKGPSTPLSGVDGWHINPNSKNKAAAVDLALYIFGKDGLKVYADVAGDPPVRTDVATADPLVKAFADAAAGGFPRPQDAWFANYWGPFTDMFTAVIEGTAKPADGIAKACADMNKANKIQ